MAKRAYSPKDIAGINHKVLPFTGKWKEVFGQPEVGDTWFITGPSASGKSSFVMQLAKMLCYIGPVLYVSLEEGVGLSMQRRLKQFRMYEEQGKFRLITDGDIGRLEARLAKPKSAKFIIVDSYQFAFEQGWEYLKTAALVDHFPKKTFIFISQEHHSKPMGKAAVRLKYKAGVKVRTIMYRAYCEGRYSGTPCSFFYIWPEKDSELRNMRDMERQQ